MKVDVYSLFIRVYETLSSCFSALSQRIQRVWGNTSSFKYAFSQQSNPDCHLQMWLNFHRLQQLRTRDPTGRLVLEGVDFKIHRQWFAESAPHFRGWLTARSGPRMQEYMTDALQEAPCAPELFDSRGQRYCDGSWTFKERVERAAFSPAFLQQMPITAMSYTLPIFEEGGSYFCYNQENSNYEQVEFHGAHNLLSPASFILSDGQKASLPADFDSLELVKLPGKTRFIQAIDPRLAVGERFVPRELGTYKLLLLNLGIDSHDAAVSRELQEAMHAAQTPWSPEQCKKEHLIEHALGTLFKEDHALAAKVQRHVDFFFRTWGRYEEDLPSLFNRQGAPFSQRQIDQHLPGKEHMLAYCLMKNVQFLWVSAMSSSAFCRHVGLPKVAQWLPFIPGPSQYKKAAYQEKEGSSFIEVWREVAARVQSVFPEQKDWVSFSGHGMVLSFDADLIRQQNQRQIDDPRLAEDLGIAGIDSLHAREMDVFYRAIA